MMNSIKMLNLNKQTKFNTSQPLSFTGNYLVEAASQRQIGAIIHESIPLSLKNDIKVLYLTGQDRTDYDNLTNCLPSIRSGYNDQITEAFIQKATVINLKA